MLKPRLTKCKEPTMTVARMESLIAEWEAENGAKAIDSAVIEAPNQTVCDLESAIICKIVDGYPWMTFRGVLIRAGMYERARVLWRDEYDSSTVHAYLSGYLAAAPSDGPDGYASARAAMLAWAAAGRPRP
jgi:hypothetical protein